MQRLKCADLERQLNDIKVEINKSSIEVDHQLSKDNNIIIGKTDANITPFMSLFWQQQKKLFTGSSS
jgi:hypothetical protein